VSLIFEAASLGEKADLGCLFPVEKIYESPERREEGGRKENELSFVLLRGCVVLFLLLLRTHV